MRAIVSIAAAVLLLAPTASGYYFFTRFLNRTGALVSAPQKFDLGAVPGRTVNFFISDQVSGLPLAANDSVTGVISQLRLAAGVWSDVETSQLRLSFAGLHAPGTPVAGPSVDILFSDDMPPGLCGQGGPVQTAEPAAGPGGTFSAIQRSVVVLPRNLCGNASHSENFFQTATHEIGHALGLQHSFTSSAMSTNVTRATSKARPLTADDIAGISLLYPDRNFLATTGAISGRVTMSGQAVTMASVVAIRPGADAIGTLTNPDGTYRIEGVPPGQYFVYVHPLPPAFDGEASPGNLVPPAGPDNRSLGFGANFDTQFFPGSKEPGFTLGVNAATTVENVNFQVQPRTRPAIYSVQTYGFIGQVTVKPPALNRNLGRATLVASGPGLQGPGSAPVAGLTVSPMSGAVSITPGSVRTYTLAPAYLQFDVTFNAFAVDGPQHLIFSASNDIYVLPSAFRLVQKAPPAIAAVQPGGDVGAARQLLISGTGLTADSRFLFDGQPGVIRALDESAGRALVVPPPAPAGHRANVVALNSDGQSSLYAQPAPAQFFYDAGDTGGIQITPSSLPAGVDSMVEIVAPGGNFSESALQAAFGSADITIKRTWVTGLNRALMNVSVGASAQPSQVSVAIANGLQLWSQPFGFGIQAANPRLITVAPASMASATASVGTQPLVQPGGAALLTVTNLPPNATPGTVVLTLNDQPVPVSGIAGNQVTFVVPAGTPVGPAVVRLRVGTESALPIVLGIDPPPPVILSSSANGAIVDASRPVRQGDQVTVTASGLLPDPSLSTVAASRLTVTVAGVEHPVLQVVPVTGTTYQIVFLLRDTVPAGIQSMTVAQDGRASNPVALPVR